MQTLRINPKLMSEMVAYCRSSRPDEACGILAGRDSVVYRVILIENVSDNPQVHYTMSPIEFLKALKRVDTEGLELIATFHSHPKSNPIPSPTDKREAITHMPNVAHLIISLRYPKAEIQAWKFSEHHADKVTILVGDAKLERISPMSQTQKIVFALMTLIGVLMLLAISFTLLPPAPPLPT